LHAEVQTPPQSRPALQTGLRLQIVLALAGLMVLAFAPLFFAVASLTRATVLDAREQSIHSLGHSIAVHVADAQKSGEAGALTNAMRQHIGQDGVEAICLFEPDGSPAACAGSATFSEGVRRPLSPDVESVHVVRGTTGRAVQVRSPLASGAVVIQLRLDLEAERAVSLVRLVALYMVIFALALLVFAYFALTRLIVRPIEELADAADRVALGARTLRVPRSGARELVDLGSSVQSMTKKLIEEESALLGKVQELTETTAQLTQTQAQLVRSERMASVGHLAAGVAHEIGNPIAALIGMQELLLDGDLSADARTDFLRRMRSETDRIHGVVRDLLDFARPEEVQGIGAGPQPPANVRTVIDEVVSLVRPQKTFRDVRFETDATDALLTAFPASRLTQVLLNMVLNAGAAVASTRENERRVSLRARSVDPGYVRIEVEDDGPGISAAVRDRLFEPFVTTKQVGEGSGLGLAVCRGLVESAGGEIGVDTSYRGGARFYVVLPSAPP
jgi:two-component system NtrC family sensor kinase